MRVFLASTGSGMSKELRDKTVKICRPRYILETFFNGEKSCLEAMSIVGNDNFLLDSGAFSYMNGAKVTLSQMDVQKILIYSDRRISIPCKEAGI